MVLYRMKGSFSLLSIFVSLSIVVSISVNDCKIAICFARWPVAAMVCLNSLNRCLAR